MALGKLVILIALLTLIGCAEGSCLRRHKEPPKVPGVANTDFSQDEKPEDTPVKPVEPRVLVYKYDGSLQCGMGKPIAVSEMQRELKGIEVFSAQKKHDGLMHIQVCGSATGQANVYEIEAKQLNKAKEKGFQLWKFN